MRDWDGNELPPFGPPAWWRPEGRVERRGDQIRRRRAVIFIVALVVAVAWITLGFGVTFRFK